MFVVVRRPKVMFSDYFREESWGKPAHHVGVCGEKDLTSSGIEW